MAKTEWLYDKIYLFISDGLKILNNDSLKPLDMYTLVQIASLPTIPTNPKSSQIIANFTDISKVRMYISSGYLLFFY